MQDSYRTIRQDAEIELVIQKSRFIGCAFKVESEERAREILSTQRKTYYDATHNCYAYRIGMQGNVARFSDDGEPQGTAGLPMMEVLNKLAVVDVLVIVTRYFGGTLLGAGGLVRAYGAATGDAVNAGGIVTMRQCEVYTLSMEYTQLGRVESLLQSKGYIVQGTEYLERPSMEVCIPKGDVERFLKEIADSTAGSVTPIHKGSQWLGG
ncbi:YigZ family protein [Clostridia bacterium OttesenSCG-928-F22]|nr:YigZ family protein [Clostridia bacterium OttesenSCG-928-F22]